MAVNDGINNSLTSYGGSIINERVYHYLGSLGYTGSISDRLAKHTFEGKKGWQAIIAEFGKGVVSSGTEQLRQSLFGAGQQGLIYNIRPSVDGSQVLWQDVAETTITDDDGEVIGNANDLSSNGNDATQSTASLKPLYKTDGSLHWAEFDGVDAFLDISGVRSGLSATVSIFIAYRRADTGNVIVIKGDSSGDYALIAQAGNTTNGIAFGDGVEQTSVITRIDEVQKTTRDAIHQATSDLDWHIWEMENMSLSAWSSMFIGNYGGGFELNGDIAGMIIVDESSTVDRVAARDYLRDLAGMTS